MRASSGSRCCARCSGCANRRASRSTTAVASTDSRIRRRRSRGRRRRHQFHRSCRARRRVRHAPLGALESLLLVRRRDAVCHARADVQRRTPAAISSRIIIAISRTRARFSSNATKRRGRRRVSRRWTTRAQSHLPRASFATSSRGKPLIENNSIWRRFPVVYTDRWSAGNVVLIGDALRSAHYSIGSGTRLAIDDAIALSGALVDTASVADGLALTKNGAGRRSNAFAKRRGAATNGTSVCRKRWRSRRSISCTTSCNAPAASTKRACAAIRRSSCSLRTFRSAKEHGSMPPRFPIDGAHYRPSGRGRARISPPVRGIARPPGEHAARRRTRRAGQSRRHRRCRNADVPRTRRTVGIACRRV